MLFECGCAIKLYYESRFRPEEVETPEGCYAKLWDPLEYGWDQAMKLQSRSSIKLHALSA